MRPELPCLPMAPSRARMKARARGVFACGMVFALPWAFAACDGGGGDARADGGLLDAGPDATTDLGPDAATPSGPSLVVAPLARLPYVEAGGGEVSLALELHNAGDAPTALTFSLSGDPLLALDPTVPASLGAGQLGTLTLRFAGSPTQHVALGTLTVGWAGGERTVQVVAVAGATGLPTAAYEPVLAAGGTPCGVGATVALPTAPFPHASANYTDASVRVFVPSGYRQHADHDLVLHFHGHNTTLASTLAGHSYEQHVCASGVNALLVVPQGPVNAASGNFGKLMSPAGTAALLDQVLVLLYRDGYVDFPVRGQLTLTAHSGGYLAVAANANAADLRVTQVHLYDALYGSIAAFRTFATSGGGLRSNYTSSGGTLTNNQSFAASLAADHPDVSLSEDATLPALRNAASVVDYTPSSHNGATRYRNAYGDRLRFGSRRGVAGGRIELRSATATAGTATVTFLAPRDEQRVGFVVEAAAGTEPFRAVAEVAPGAETASWSVTGDAALRVRVRSRLDDPGTIAEASDTYALTPDADVLVVDAFERVLGGSHGARAHDIATRVGVPLGASTVSHRALTEDGFELTGYRAVVWLAGDQSRDDEPISADEQLLLGDYLDAGGALLVSGSEVAFSLQGGAFLGRLGAGYVSDDAGSLVVGDAGALGGAFVDLGFGGPNAAYEEDFPDVLSAGMGADVLLRYGTGGAAAVGVAGRAVLVGFPLEVVDDDAQRTALTTALLAFATGS
ncbi:MAG: hypothetical protein KC668_20480 [Myxococcales bacterium]|nr:hypothetical protein [Myxococcales bacterium]